MPDLRDSRTWRRELGLLPIPLFGNNGRGNAYVLLNGARGNFCLYLNRERHDKAARNEAWSANVGHSVAIVDDSVYVQRWDDLPSLPTPGRSLAEVSDSLLEFHRFLEENAPPSELSVVAHAIGVFRSLRTALHTGDGQSALQTFLVLLAAAIDGVKRSEFSPRPWKLADEACQLASGIDEDTWQALTDELINGRGLGLRADLTLTLRHAAGLLFQEAHYVALTDPQLSIPGIVPAPIHIRQETASIGLHFTPPALARAIVEETLRVKVDAVNLTIFDPACGSGEFLREVLRQLELSGFPGRLTLIGFDISPAACAMAEFVLAWESATLTNRITNVEIRTCDALHPATIWPEDVDMVLMNPPFLSWPAMSTELRGVVSRTLGDLSHGRPDLAMAFLWKAVNSLAATGAIGAILPAPFLDGRYSEALRDKLAERLDTRLVARLGSHSIFHEALVDACFYVAQRGEQRSVPLCLWASHKPSSSAMALRALRRLRTMSPSETGPIEDNERDGFSIYPNPDLGQKAKPWAPRPLRDWRLSKEIDDVPPVRSRFAVRQGVLTGHNRAFILDPSRWQALPERERTYFRPCIFHEAVRGGQLKPSAYVFFPYGAYAIGSEKALTEAVPTYYGEWLLSNEEELKSREGFEEDWWLLTRPRLEWQGGVLKKIVTAYFGAAGSFAWDSEGLAVVVQGYGWISRSKRGLARKVWLGYLAILNSEVFASLLAVHSNHVSGGQWNLSKRFVEAIPLPDLATVAVDIANDLAELGTQIHQSGLNALSKNDRARLKEVTDAAYFFEKRE